LVYWPNLPLSSGRGAPRRSATTPTAPNCSWKPDQRARRGRAAQGPRRRRDTAPRRRHCCHTPTPSPSALAQAKASSGGGMKRQPPNPTCARRLEARHPTQGH